MGLQNSLPSPTGTLEKAPAGFSTTVTDTTLSEALITLRKRRWVLITAAVFGLSYGVYKAETQPRVYEAFGRIQVRSGSSNEYRVSAVPGYSNDSASKMLTEIAILQSDSLMLTVAREMDLANNAAFLEAKGPVPHVSLDDAMVRQSTVHRLQSNLNISLVPKTDIIRINYKSLNSKLAADIVNKVISAYIQRSYETRFASTQRVSQWLSSQLDDLKQQVQISQERMMDLQRRLGIDSGVRPNSQPNQFVARRSLEGSGIGEDRPDHSGIALSHAERDGPGYDRRLYRNDSRDCACRVEFAAGTDCDR